MGSLLLRHCAASRPSIFERLRRRGWTVETVNESAQDRQRSLELFSSGREGEWRNRLIWGNKKYVLPSLLAEFCRAGGSDLQRPAL